MFRSAVVWLINYTVILNVRETWHFFPILSCPQILSLVLFSLLFVICKGKKGKKKKKTTQLNQKVHTEKRNSKEDRRSKNEVIDYLSSVYAYRK